MGGLEGFKAAYNAGEDLTSGVRACDVVPLHIIAVTRGDATFLIVDGQDVIRRSGLGIAASGCWLSCFFRSSHYLLLRRFQLRICLFSGHWGLPSFLHDLI